ncbi:MAG: DNA replication/repair protein RecF [Defluviitaleaceae bacterium]|nr:DNA replication/repair protein RecF [Defluviitaleaceae bacterium]
MYIKSIAVNDFRNLRVSEIELSQNINIIHGNNAQGKTNFLEAVYFCALGRSLRAASDVELVNFDAKSANIRAEVVRGAVSSRMDMYLEKQGNRAKKYVSVNRVPIRHMKDLFGRILVVMFTPEDLQLIKSGPAERRRFMDLEICQLSPIYYSELKEYHRALKQRNALLKSLQKDKSQTDSLEIWDEQLCKHGSKIMQTRESFINKISDAAAIIHKNITSGKETLKINYIQNITENYLEEMAKSHTRDIYQGSTSRGIHKDDIKFTINEIPVRNFGSQGQQRTAALSAKLAEIEIIKQSTGESPILLLDDVLSELDSHRQKFLLEEIVDLQTIITCTGVEDVLKLDNGYTTMVMDAGCIKMH